MSDEKTNKQSRTRSPAYPAIDLDEAICKAAKMWEKATRHAVSVDVAGTYWGYDVKSSAAISAASALKKYGLIVEEGSNEKRTVRLSDLGIKLIYNPDPENDEYKASLITAALSPAIHLELFNKYGSKLPDDSVIKRYLVVERKFNNTYVDCCISNFKKSIALAKLDVTGIFNEAVDAYSDTLSQMTSVPQSPKPTMVTSALQSAASIVRAQGATSAFNQRTDLVPPANELSLPLENGKIVRIPKMTEGDYDLMLETLKLWKRRIVVHYDNKEAPAGVDN